RPYPATPALFPSASQASHWGSTSGLRRGPRLEAGDEVGDADLQRGGDAVQRGERRGRLRTLDLRQHRDAQPGTPRDLLEGEPLVGTRTADRGADRLVHQLV